jgi:hypothetical protein
MFKASLKRIIEERMKAEDMTVKELAAKLDYSGKYAEVAERRLQKILSGEFLGMTEGEYDFQYTNREILTLVCGSLNISEAIIECGINEIWEEYHRRKSLFRTYIKIEPENDIRPCGMSACLLDHRIRTVYMPVGLTEEELSYRLYTAENECREHYAENKGDLGRGYGRILSYKYYYAGNAYVDIIPENGDVRIKGKINVAKNEK